MPLSYLKFPAHLICDLSKHHFPGEFALAGGHGVASVSPSDPPNINIQLWASDKH